MERDEVVKERQGYAPGWSHNVTASGVGITIRPRVRVRFRIASES